MSVQPVEWLLRGGAGPTLRLLTRPARRLPRAPFVVIVLAVLSGGLLGLLVLNTLLAQDAFSLHDLQRRSTMLQDREQALRQQLQTLSSPGALAARATALGMVPGGDPTFLRIPDGALLGAPLASPPPAAGRTAPAVAAPARPAPSKPAVSTRAASTTALPTAPDSRTTSKVPASRAAVAKAPAPRATGPSTAPRRPGARR